MSLSRVAMLLLAGLLAFGVGGPVSVGVLGASAAEAPAAPQPQAQRVNIGLILSIASTPIFVARDRGYFEAENVDLQYEPVQVTSEAIAQVGSGNLDLAVATVGAAVLNTVARGIDIKIISGNHGNPPQGVGGDPMLVRKALFDSGEVRDAAGLRGRKVAGNSTGVYTEYAIEGAMRTAGLSVADVDFQPIPFPDIPQALTNAAVDGAFVPEPAASQAIETGAAVQIVPDYLRGAQISVLVAGPSFLRDRSVAEAWMRAYLRGLRDVNAEGFTSPSIAETVERYTRVPAGTVQRILPQYYDVEGRINWDSLEDQQRFYMGRGYVNYQQPLDLLHLSEDGPRQAALAAVRQ